MRKLTVPEWMIPSQTRVRTIKFRGCRCSVAMNTTQAAMPVLYSLDFDGCDPEGWDHTPFQTADFRHWLDASTVRRIWNWLGTVAA